MGNLANLRNVKFLKTADYTRSGFDYLRLNFDTPISFFENKLRGLPSNSSFIVEDGFTYTRVTLGSGLCVMVSYSYNGVAVPIILYNVFGGNNMYIRYARMDFYGSFFRLIAIGEFSEDYFTEYVKNLTDEDPTISRVDWCFDLFYDDFKKLPTRKSIIKKINITSKGYNNTVGDDVESWSVGSKKNKRYIIRMYNKLQDILVKQKYFLYGDYLKYKSVHRFELEFGPKFTRGYKLSTLLALKDKIYSFLGFDDTIFDGCMFYKYSSKFELNDYNKTWFFKQYLSKTKKIFDANENPHLVNFLGLCVHTQTEYDKQVHIGYLEQVLEIAKSKDDLKGYFS